MQNNQQSSLLHQLSQQLQELQLSTKGQQQSNSVDFNQQQLKDITNSSQDPQSQFKFVYSVPSIVDPDPINCILEPSNLQNYYILPGEDLGGIFLGNFEGASNVDLLRSNKIRAVLTASIETGLKYSEEVIHFHEIIQAHDKENYDIVQHFEKAYDFIDKTRKFTNVLVHCFAGISRSASLIIAYLMKKYNMSFETALWKLKSKRRQVNPNVGFVRQLQKYEKILQQQQSFQNYNNLLPNNGTQQLWYNNQYGQQNQYQYDKKKNSFGNYEQQQYQQYQQQMSMQQFYNRGQQYL